MMAETLETMQAKIKQQHREIAARAKTDETARRLMTIPGIGPVAATAPVALAPAASTFRLERVKAV